MLGGCPYVCTYVKHARFCEKLDLDPWALDPSPPIFTSPVGGTDPHKMI